MNVIKLTFSISLSFFLLFINLNNGIKSAEIKNVRLFEKNDCGIDTVTLKTERTSKKRKFLFWKLRHNKVIVIDRIVDSNGNKVFEKKSVFICSMDACDTRRFNHLRIVENEIWLFNYGKNFQQDGIIKKYNFCGEFVGTKDWEIGDYNYD